ncbi:MAG: EAL domain-containing protein [Acidobacteriota bacterium]
MAPDPQVFAACEDLRRQGYLLALDDFVERSGQTEFLEFADVVKVEIASLPMDEHAELVKRFHSQGKKMLAEKVETPEEFAEVRKIGYDYFQGYFFARPDGGEVAADSGDEAKLHAACCARW